MSAAIQGLRLKTEQATHLQTEFLREKIFSNKKKRMKIETNFVGTDRSLEHFGHTGNGDGGDCRIIIRR